MPAGTDSRLAALHQTDSDSWYCPSCTDAGRINLVDGVSEMSCYFMLEEILWRKGIFVGFVARLLSVRGRLCLCVRSFNSFSRSLGLSVHILTYLCCSMNILVISLSVFLGVESTDSVEFFLCVKVFAACNRGCLRGGPGSAYCLVGPGAPQSGGATYRCLRFSRLGKRPDHSESEPAAPGCWRRACALKLPCLVFRSRKAKPYHFIRRFCAQQAARPA